MSDTEIIVLLAVQRRPDGSWRFSANKIAALVGGTREKVLATVAQLRKDADPAPAAPAAGLDPAEAQRYPQRTEQQQATRAWLEQGDPPPDSGRSVRSAAASPAS